VALIIGQQHVVITREQRFDERPKDLAVAVREGSVVEKIENLGKFRVRFVVAAGSIAVGSDALDFRSGQTKQEEILGSDRLADLDIGSVERADSQRTVERKLHVAGARGLLARRRDLFGQ